MRTFQLHRPVSLQMACVGSRSRIIFGARADVGIGELVVKDRYFDVANVDKYDAILGLPFLWATTATIRFQGAGILDINGQSFDLLESDFAVKRRVSSRDQTNRAAAPTKHGSAAVPPVNPRAHMARMGRIQYFEDDSTVVAKHLSTADESCKPEPNREFVQQVDSDCDDLLRYGVDVCAQAVSTNCTTEMSLFTSAGVQELDEGLLNGTTSSRSNQTYWFDKIPMVDFILNSSTNTTTGLTPFETVYGYAPQTASRLSIPTPTDLAIRMHGETGVADPNATLPSTILVRPCDPEICIDADAALEDTRREQWEKEQRETRESQAGHH
ncbi:hypothetical protein EXIGLDRAFT_768623 [Exidia glandulosa HHB12029]|uniref:Uncharacterized protein n=1 Tax=Exidia glandulosa HHB12029 TaxID=1314781 RepID=A0A165I287_EXIGL|nr:hypothetical protein EXIGLDRAFT_768623 [Exidia glandulosa HHB12029]